MWNILVLFFRSWVLFGWVVYGRPGCGSGAKTSISWDRARSGKASTNGTGTSSASTGASGLQYDVFRACGTRSMQFSESWRRKTLCGWITATKKLQFLWLNSPRYSLHCDFCFDSWSMALQKITTRPKMVSKNTPWLPWYKKWQIQHTEESTP